MLTKDMIDLIHHVRLGFATTHADGSPIFSQRHTRCLRRSALVFFFIIIASPDTVQNIHSPIHKQKLMSLIL